MVSSGERISTVLCIDIDKERITGGIVSPDASVSIMRATRLKVGVQDQMMRTVLQFVSSTLAHATEHLHQPSAVALSLDALVDRDMVRHADGLLRGLVEKPLAESITQQVGLPTLLENAVNARAYAEASVGIGRDLDNFVYIFADEDLGMAFFQYGRLWRGERYSSGHIGSLVADWMAEKPISLAQRASGVGLVQEYNKRSRKFRVPSLRDIIQFAESDDQLAVRVLRDGARICGGVLGPVISLLDPHAVIVGGQLVTESGVWWQTFKMTLEKALLPPQQGMQILPASLPTNDAALIGMAALLDQQR